ncbi:MAG TPA: protein kinase [Kofleriaceae bacterium]|nr:protein kinase [Kofleriaceae bacterium]
MIEGALATGRYQVLRRIGAGGMGVVYEAEDRERGQRVALKTITSLDVEKVYQLKREFRGLADLSHPNLVALYDLVVDTDACFFTMELLDGEDLLSYLWNRPAFGPADDTAHAATTGRGAAALRADAAPTLGMPATSLLLVNRRAMAHRPTDPPPVSGVDVITPAISDAGMLPTPCDLDRLRSALPQLARGLHALHAAGKIHRDVKPSNIRVTSDGRVVLLDFGLVAELERRRGEQGAIVGTAAYMAPEQGAGDLTLSAAADWYSVGVIMFQALTGKLPFDGSPARMVLDKQVRTAVPPSKLVRGVPAELDQLCRELLEREPTDRPSGRALLRRLGTDGDTGPLTPPSLSYEVGFAGRDLELGRLEAAIAALDRRRPSVAVVRAPSGMGKSSLCHRFFDRARASRDELLVLRGRCFEREDVPYKAIDDLIDELSDWWLELAPKDAQAILPRDACLLPTLFPVLGRVPAIADAPTTRQVADPQELRTYAFAALREALQRLADRRPVALFLDDMQWVDRDTTTLLADLMRAPDPPPMLLVLATRVEGSGPVLDLVRRFDADVQVIDVAPLDEAAAIELALNQIGSGNRDIARRLVGEAGGSPLFLMELCRFLQGRSVDDIAGKGLDAMLSERIDGLGEAARILAEVIAVAGEPLPRRSLTLATSLPAVELSRQLGVLRAQRVLRVSGSRAEDTIEPYHDRVREALLATLPAARRARHHRALATALSGRGTAEQLARHWHGAGELERAAGFARRAGDEARAKLDFDRAARCYQMALEGTSWNADERRTLGSQLGDALADAGRPREAADQFLRTAEGSDAAIGLELRRRAAGQLLQSGYVDEGLELTRGVLSEVGVSFPRTPLRALASMLLRRAWLRLRGLRFRPRPVSECSQAELTRVDVCESVSFGLAFVDPFRSADFAARFLHAALRLGEPWRVSRALALEADWLSAMYARERAERLLTRLEQMTAAQGTALAESQLLTTRGMLDFLLYNRWPRALERFAAAIDLYRAVVGRAGFEIDTVSMFCCFNLYYLGALGELSRRVPQMVQHASRMGNRYTAVTLRCGFPVAWLARLDPDDIEGEIVDAVASWDRPDGPRRLQHLFALCSRLDLAIYRGDPESAVPLLETELPRIRREMLDRAPIYDLLLRSTIGRHALARATAAPAGSDRRRAALADVRKISKRFARARMPLMRSCAAMLDALSAELDGRIEAAIADYRTALASFDQTETHLFGYAIRHRLGRLLGGDEGEALRAPVGAWLDGEGVREPARMLTMLLPGPPA